MPSAWECGACTWLNDQCSVDCLMCQTKRPRNLPSPNARKTEEAAVCRQAADASNNVMPEKKSLHQKKINDDDDRKEPTKEVKPHVCDQDNSISIHHSESNKQQEKYSVKKNESNTFFASLENNYESSDSGEEDESDSDSDGSDGSENYYQDDEDEYKQYDDGQVGEDDQSQWNAFKTLEATLGDDSSSSDSSSSSSSGEDCILIEDIEEKKMAFTKTSNKNNSKAECVDLVDTDDEEDMQEEKRKTKPKPKRINSRKRKRASDPSAITLMDDDSDASYLSEVDGSRPLQPSPASRQTRSIPPWQRAARSNTKSTSTTLQNHRVLPRESFSLFSTRNDVSGSGLNETRTSAPPPAAAAAAAARQPKQRKTSTKSSTSTNKSGSRRRKRSNSDGAAPAKKKRRTRKYRRSSKRGGRGGRGGAAASSSSRNNNPWGARERGIRQPIRGNNGSGGPYMNITKQEPMLRNIGGASIQF